MGNPPFLADLFDLDHGPGEAAGAAQIAVGEYVDLLRSNGGRQGLAVIADKDLQMAVHGAILVFQNVLTQHIHIVGNIGLTAEGADANCDLHRSELVFVDLRFIRTAPISSIALSIQHFTLFFQEFF